MNRTQLTTAVIWLDAIAEAAKAKSAELRADLAADAKAEYEEQGTAPTWRIPDVATVSASVSHEAAYVDDERAFVRWVTERYPDEVVTSVRPSWQKAFLSAATIDGDSVADRSTGEVVPGLGVREGGRLTGVSIRATSDAKGVFAAVAEHSLKELAASAGPGVPVVLAELEATDASA